MSQVPRGRDALVAVLTMFSLGAILEGVYLCSKTSLGIAELSPIALVIGLAIALEYRGTETPPLGYHSLAVATYVALWVAASSWAVLGAAVACVIRVIAKSRQPWYLRVVDCSTVVLPVFVASVVYTVFGGTVVGLLLSIVAYLALDTIFCYLLARLLIEQNHREGWLSTKARGRIQSLFAIPVGYGAAFLLNVTGMQLAAALLLVLPLVALHGSLTVMPQSKTAVPKENPEELVSGLREEILGYKSQNRTLMADLHKQVEEMAILRDMGQQLGASKDLDKTLEIIISMIRKLLIYQSCVIYLVDTKGALVPAKCVSPYKDIIELSPLLQLEESMVNLVIQSKKPILVSDMQGGAEHRIFNDEKSIMCVPLIVKDIIIGVVYVGTLRPGTYNDDHVHLLETLANPAAIAIKSAQFHESQEEALVRERQLSEQNQERVNQLNVLYHLGTDLNRCVKLAEIADTIAEKLAMLLKFQSCIVFVLVPKDQLLHAIKVASPYQGLFKDYTINPQDDEGILGWVARNKRHVLLSDASQSRFANLIERERSFMLVPLVVEDEVIGEIYIGAADPGKYDDEILGLATMVAAQAAMALQKALLFERTEGLAITDGNTGLYTHRYFQERLSEEVRWADRYGHPLSLVMVDTDHFKQFNDTLGHPEGDRLLKEISALLRQYTRESDLVCRYGGDEFTLILKDTDKESAIVTAERIRDAFQTRFGTLPVKITASIGVSNFPVDARTKADLMNAVDEALYKSKKGGRNRVSSAQPFDGGNHSTAPES